MLTLEQKNLYDKKKAMNEIYLDAGYYLINQRSEKSGSTIVIEKIILHEEAFALIFQSKPSYQFF